MDAHEAPKKSKRPHQKTRTGCRRCKQRRVKCDEQKPACGNCIRHSAQCDFLLNHTPSSSASPASQPAQTVPEHASPFPGAGDSSSIGPTTPSLQMNELELLHNYSNSTYATISLDPVMRTLWRTTVPELGFSYPFVMHGILAISALHLAHFRPERREFYLSQAMHHHHIGLGTAISIVPHITQENCTALYAFSSFAFIFALARPRKDDNLLLIGDIDVAEWLFLIRGTRTIVEFSYSALLAGPLGSMFITGGRRSALREQATAEDDQLFTELTHLLETNVSDAATLEVYSKSIFDLKRSFNIFYSTRNTHDEGCDAFEWIFRLSNEFVELLRNRAQESLAIFAFFCVLLKHLDSYWWSNGWSIHLISRIYSLLDNEHRLWIRWPIEEIGWIPNS